jgi:hypothetical protein
MFDSLIARDFALAPAAAGKADGGRPCRKRT